MLQVLRGDRGLRVHETGSLDELASVARKIASSGTDAVVLAGGDGSAMAGLTALATAFGGEPPPLALAPGGTVCTIARNFGLGGDRVDYTRALLASVRDGTARRTTSTTLEVREEGGASRLGFIFGTGLVSSFFEAYYAAGPGESLGLGAAAGLVARIFAQSFVGGPLARRVLTPQPALATVDGVAAPHEGYSLLVASVVRDLGLHMWVTYRARERPRRFHVVGSALGPGQLGPQMPRVLVGRPLVGPGIDALASSLAVRFTGDRTGYVLDGELLGASGVSVSLGPEITLLSV